MNTIRNASIVALLLTVPSLFSLAQTCSANGHPTFRISVDPELGSTPASGRLLVMMSSQPLGEQGLSPSFGKEAHDVWVAAREVSNLGPKSSADLDPDELAFPDAFCRAPAGNYKMQAILDVDHNFAYTPVPTAGDLSSAIEEKKFDPAANDVITLTLTSRKAPPPIKPAPNNVIEDFVSPALSQFRGEPVHIRAIVVLPPGYATGQKRYPTVYWTHGFGATFGSLVRHYGPEISKMMQEKKAPEMIWVLMLQGIATGTHEFADSVNNGPWGKTLTTEFVPYLEHKYRMDAKPAGRLLTGHSSGGWTSLWLQARYPAFFGGTWPTSPDPSDFRAFTGIDLTKRPSENFYRKEDGSPRMLIRMDGQDVESWEDLARQERVTGDYGGQMASFEWVFSPRADDGRPRPLFDRDTGVIDTQVADYWEKNFDIAQRLRTNWKTIGPLLNGKIHLTVGTQDTFHLDESARALEETIKQLGGKATFTYLEGRTHFDLYKDGLEEKIAGEMYAVARPAVKKAKK